MRSILSVSLVFIVGISLLWSGTDGFRAFTSEGARRLAVQNVPRELPQIQLEDQNGKAFTLQEMKGRLVQGSHAAHRQL